MEHMQENQFDDVLSLFSSLLEAGSETILKKMPNETASYGSKQELLDLVWPCLTDRLFPLVEPTIMSHFLLAKDSLDGETVLDKWKSYCELLHQEEVKEYFLTRFPLLSERIMLETAHWVHHQARMCERYLNDEQEIVNLLFNGKTPGKICAIRPNMGDKHLGESVTLLTFENQVKLMYVPRNRSLHTHMQAICDWLNTSLNAGLRLPAIVSRSTHAWIEFIPHNECHSEEQIHRFYERMGIWLAVFYTLDATDFHCENLIACGEYPVPVDLETLFHPFMPFEVEDRHNGLFNSVLKTGLLPSTFTVESSKHADMSGLGNPEGANTSDTTLSFSLSALGEISCRRKKSVFASSSNLPVLDGKTIEPNTQYANDLKQGFRRAYLFLLKYREAYIELLQVFRHDRIRLLFRNTATYGHLLREGLHPDALRNPEARDKQLKWLEKVSDLYPEAKVFIESEKADLRRGDIPFFHTEADSKDIRNGKTNLSTDFFRHSGFETSIHKITHLSIDDLEKQCWIINLSLSLLGIGQTTTSLTNNRSLRQEKKTGLLEVACSLADNLIGNMSINEDRASWMVFMPIDLESSRFALAPASFDLYSGLPGEIVCLSCLSRQTGIKLYEDVAGKALNELIARIEEGCSVNKLGLFAGWGGLIYTMAYLSRFQNDTQWLGLAKNWLERLNPCEMMLAEDNHGVVNGAAGFILGLLAAYQVGKDRQFLELADKMGSALLRHSIRTQDQIRWKSYSNKPLAGLSHGASGYAVCFSRLFRYTGIRQYKDVVRKILNYETHLYDTENRNWPDLRSIVAEQEQDKTVYSTAWSHGAPGIGLARLEVLRCGIRDRFIINDVENALNTCLESGFNGGDNLCFGNFGNLELLISYADFFSKESVKTMYQRMAGELIERGMKKGFNVTGKGSYTPGLMNGITGVIYQCMRVHDPRHVPSILSLSL